MQLHLEQAILPRPEPHAMHLLHYRAVASPPGDHPLPGMVGEHAHVALAGGVVQRRVAADWLIDAHGGGEGPRHQREFGDRLPTERQTLRRDRIVGAAVGEPVVGRRRLEDRYLFLEDGAVVVIGSVMVADVDPKHVRFTLFGASPEATEQLPARPSAKA